MFDFKTREQLVTPNEEEVHAAFEKFITIQSRYPDLSLGYMLPDPVPDDLTMPASEFIRKYGLGDAVGTIASFGQHVGLFLDLAALYTFKHFSLDLIDALKHGFIRTAFANNSAIYGAAQKKLEGDVLLSSTIISTN
ncbi:hypothetical protein N7456_008424 [Penicillium angulare]|uniref:Uncharacterized protein n=1 Tax=Penicillium angulare TaxID=116970 RepID=A0A9W9FCJ8_9EURO|nr:hypothetical protein N7456_008424 [Penicillium angulare]